MDCITVYAVHGLQFGISWWRHQMETFSSLLAICAGNSPVSGEFSAQRSVTRSFDVFFDLRLNKRLSNQSWGWWFEMLSRPLWRHRNVKSWVISDVWVAAQSMWLMGCRPVNTLWWNIRLFEYLEPWVTCDVLVATQSMRHVGCNPIITIWGNVILVSGALSYLWYMGFNWVYVAHVLQTSHHTIAKCQVIRVFGALIYLWYMGCNPVRVVVYGLQTSQYGDMSGYLSHDLEPWVISDVWGSEIVRFRIDGAQFHSSGGRKWLELAEIDGFQTLKKNV